MSIRKITFENGFAGEGRSTFKKLGATSQARRQFEDFDSAQRLLLVVLVAAAAIMVFFGFVGH